MEDATSEDEPTVLAAGGVVWRHGVDGIDVLLVHRPKYDDWTLPKGKNDPDESDEDAARREVLEETALRCELGDELQTVFYVDAKGRPKRVRYWAMYPVASEPDDPEFTPNDEIDELAWMTVPMARAWLSYDRDRVVLDGFEPPISSAAP
jgi:8-oxo-dGTP pyrophosphatase MutT (NUDIX family)